MRVTLSFMLFSFVTFFLQAHADYMPHVEEIEVAPGVRAWAPAVEVMKEFNATNHVIGLYKKSFPSNPSKSKNSDVAVISDSCFTIFVNTLEGQPELITQIRVKDPKNCYKN